MANNSSVVATIAARNSPTTIATMTAAAQQYGTYNTAGGKTVSIASSDVQYGTWDSTARTFTNSGSVSNAVKVTARRDNSTGGNARLIASGTNAIVDFTETIGPNSDGQISAGSIEGSGKFYIGSGNTLTVGAGVQASYDHTEPDAGKSDDQFALNHLRLYFSGDITKNISAMVNTELPKLLKQYGYIWDELSYAFRRSRQIDKETVEQY